MAVTNVAELNALVERVKKLMLKKELAKPLLP